MKKKIHNSSKSVAKYAKKLLHTIIQTNFEKIYKIKINISRNLSQSLEIFFQKEQLRKSTYEKRNNSDKTEKNSETAEPKPKIK